MEDVLRSFTLVKVSIKKKKKRSSITSENHAFKMLLKVTISKISVSFSLVAPMAISGNCRCVFGSHFLEIQTVRSDKCSEVKI